MLTPTSCFRARLLVAGCDMRAFVGLEAERPSPPFILTAVEQTPIARVRSRSSPSLSHDSRGVCRRKSRGRRSRQRSRGRLELVHSLRPCGGFIRTSHVSALGSAKGPNVGPTSGLGRGRARASAVANSAGTTHISQTLPGCRRIPFSIEDSGKRGA
jgi:hypothetical protein